MVDAASKRKPRPGRGKAKGNSFENQVAKRLSEALGPLKFIRTQGSGARVGGKNYEALGQLFGEDALKLFVGDVVPVNEKESRVKFLYSIECKSYAKSDSFETMVAGNANIFKWMNESVDDAKKIDRIPMLVFKWNRTPTYVALLIEDSEKEAARMTIQQGDLTLSVFYLDDLLKNKNFWISEIHD
jgi:hypothetical protein